jgi:hypothetical protein
MKGVKKGVVAHLREKQPKVIDIHCACHLVSLTVKAAIKILPLKVDEVLVDIYYHFHHSTKRVESLKDYTEFCCMEYKTLLKHSETRWLSLTQSIKRTLEMWDALCTYFTSHPDVEKPGKVKTIASHLNQPFTKAWLLFLSNVLVVFDKFNVYFQTTQTTTIHKLHGESERLLKTVLSFFIVSDVLRQHASDLTKISYTDPNIQLSQDDIFVGDDTSAFLLSLVDEGEDIRDFYDQVIKFYEAFMKKQLKAFDFKSEIFKVLSFLDPCKWQSMTPASFDLLEKYLPVPFDKTAIKQEYREFAAESDLTHVGHDAVKFWTNVYQMKSPMGEPKHIHLSNLALQLLSIPASNADSERVFSLVRRIKTDFRSSLSVETLSALIGCHGHFNSTGKCCELDTIDTVLLEKAKACTRERNLSYRK